MADLKRFVAALLGAAAFVGMGCSDPDAAILARLDETEQARFKRGQQVAVPCWTCHDLAGTVKKVGPVEDMVARLQDEYEAAKAALAEATA